jgi:hypothetical protein
VRHRLPRIWARVLARQVRVGWVRQVARATRHLSVAAASAVDAAMVEEVDGRLPWSRFLAKLDGQVVAADPETASARAAAKQQETFAKASRGSEDGMKGFFLRAPTAWVVRIDATVAYLAQALQALGDPDEEDHRRAKAMLILANPTQAVEILAAFAAHRAKHPAAGANPATRAEPVDDPLPLNDADADADDDKDADGEGEAADDLDDLDGGDGEDRGADPDAAHVSGAEPEDKDDSGTGPEPAGGPEASPHTTATDDPVPDDAAGDATEAGSAGSAGVVPVPFRPEELPAWLARAVTPEGVRLLDWPRLLPSVTLYLHLARDTLHTGPDGVLRWEGEGPITLQYLRDHLAPYQHLSVTPVLDLAGQAPVDAYEIPHRHRVAVRLRTPADTFPFAANLDPVDLDHTEAYHHAPTTTDSHRPDASDGTGAGTGTASGWRPGQSRMDNYSPLGRFHHRIKTFGRWQVRQPFDGIYIWRDPHGHYYLVDHTGTRKTTPPTQRPSTTPRPTPPARSRPTLVIELYRTDTTLDTDDFAWAA